MGSFLGFLFCSLHLLCKQILNEFDFFMGKNEIRKNCQSYPKILSDWVKTLKDLGDLALAEWMNECLETQEARCRFPKVQVIVSTNHMLKLGFKSDPAGLCFQTDWGPLRNKLINHKKNRQGSFVHPLLKLFRLSTTKFTNSTTTTGRKALKLGGWHSAGGRWWQRLPITKVRTVPMLCHRHGGAESE